MDGRVHQVHDHALHAVDRAVVLEAPRRHKPLMRREAGDELGVQEFDRATTPGILAVAAHTKRHGALVRRRVLNAVRDLDLRRIGRCERDERPGVERGRGWV